MLEHIEEFTACSILTGIVIGYVLLIVLWAVKEWGAVRTYL